MLSLSYYFILPPQLLAFQIASTDMPLVNYEKYVSVHSRDTKVSKIHKKFILLHSIHFINLPHFINYVK